MNEWKTIEGPLECLVMDRHHYKPISSGYWGLTSLWDMGNVGHDRVACSVMCVCVCMSVSVGVCVVCGQSFWEGATLTGGPFSVIQVEDWISWSELLIKYLAFACCYVIISTKENKKWNHSIHSHKRWHRRWRNIVTKWFSTGEEQNYTSSTTFSMYIKKGPLNCATTMIM